MQIRAKMPQMSSARRFYTGANHELNAISSHMPLVAWGMDVIGPIEPAASNGHRFILVAIDYFTKWVEAASYKSVTKWWPILSATI